MKKKGTRDKGQGDRMAYRAGVLGKAALNAVSEEFRSLTQRLAARGVAIHTLVLAAAVPETAEQCHVLTRVTACGQDENAVLQLREVLRREMGAALRGDQPGAGAVIQ